MVNGPGEQYELMIMEMESSGTKISTDYVRSVFIEQDTKHRIKDDQQDRALTANWNRRKQFIATCF